MITKYNGMKRAGDWAGKDVELAREVSTGAARHPAGLKGRIRSTSNKGLNFECEPCKCCGIRAYINGLGYFDVILRPAADQEGGNRADG